MNAAIRDELKKELQARGYSPDGRSPNDTMIIDELSLDDMAIADLLDTMVCRREKAFRSSEVVGPACAKQTYDDAVVTIDAVKAVVAKMSLL